MRKKTRVHSFSILLLISIFIIRVVVAQPANGLVPAPVSFVPKSGHFLIDNHTSIAFDNPADSSSARIFHDYVLKYYDVSISINTTTGQPAATIKLQRIPPSDAEREGYQMNISEHSIIIRGDEAGIFYGLMSLQQLLVSSSSSAVEAPCCEITDHPRFSWRGMMLDVSRHFFSKEEVEQYIDYLAYYKMNVFHWHLTDDQGWRIEIKKYPQLTQVGGWRNGTLIGHYSDHPEFDAVRYGGYYTQDDIREVVAYAKKRKITVVPEIEMPGHVTALLAAYPALACSGGPFEVGKTWGVYTDVLCPTPEAIYFMEDVLDEVMTLFPSQYIHIGGDECPKDRWKTSPFCQQLVKELKLKDENQLQGYFTKQIEKYVKEKGRTIIGWDEILEGDTFSDAAIMSWRGMQGGIAAAMYHHPVVMSPTDFCYFDYYQSKNPHEPLAIGGYVPVEKVYSFNPVDGIPVEQQQFILGAQANLWTEYIPDFKKVQYMIFPRLCALSEVCWSPVEKRNFDDFSRRLLQFQFSKFELWNVNYSTALLELKMSLSPAPDGNGLMVRLTAPDKNSLINYNLSSYENEVLSATNNTNFELGPVDILLRRSVILNAIGKDAQGNKSPELVQQFSITKSTGKQVTLSNEPSLKYNMGGAFTLVDGISGRIPWNGSEWLGFQGQNVTAMIDLGTKQPLSKVSAGVLQDEASWIYLPSQIEVQLSNDGTTFRSIGKKTGEAINKAGGRKATFLFTKTTARYVKVIFTKYGKIPVGKAGAGNGGWLFLDEDPSGLIDTLFPTEST